MTDHPGSDRRIEIVPSVLPADFSRLGAEVAALQEAGVDRIQWDVMDGRFVPNLTFGPDVIAACRAHAAVVFEAHLMVNTPEVLLAEYIEAGCQLITIHAESTVHLHRCLSQINEGGSRAAVTIVPSTPISAIEHVLDLVDMVLVMTVNPGFGGQTFIPRSESKVRAVRALLDREGSRAPIEVDGGIDVTTAPRIVAAGADILVAGNAVFGSPDPERAIRDLRAAATAAVGS